MSAGRSRFSGSATSCRVERSTRGTAPRREGQALTRRPRLPLREEFPALAGLSYFNAAGEGPLPRCAAAALTAAATEKERPEALGRRHYQGLPEAVRGRLARLIGASPDEIALTGSTSSGVGIAARELPVRHGGEVLLLEGQFPANVFPWAAAEARGARIRRATVPPSGSPLDAVAASIGPQTAIVALDWVGFSTGIRADLEAIGALCRERGALLFVDGAQGVGAVRCDVRATGAAMMSAPGHKWLLGPQGTGFLYVAREWIGRIHPYNAGWMNIATRSGFQSLLSAKGDPPDDATRFECGTPPVLLLAAWLASLELLDTIGPEAVESYLCGFARRLRETAAHAGLTVLHAETAGASPIVVVTAGEHTVALHRALTRAGVITALREGTIRLSPHVYNDESDLERFGEAARSALASRPA